MKKQGKQADISEFRAQLDALGLKIIQVTADGNCFFRSVFSGLIWNGQFDIVCVYCNLIWSLLLVCRALADQLEGNEEGHEKYRSMVVRYILVGGKIDCCSCICSRWFCGNIISTIFIMKPYPIECTGLLK